VFDYRTLRLVVGFVAFTLPIIVSWISTTPLSSISASYYTEARDVFVGSLFIVGALLLAYKGHDRRQIWVSNLGAVAAVCTALSPTSSEACEGDIKSTIHYIAAFILFSTIAYFCLVAFRNRVKDTKDPKGKLRARIYSVCGWVIVVVMLGAVFANFLLPCETSGALSITYWAEFAALWAFGVSWIVAGKIFGLVVDRKHQLVLTAK